MRKIESRDYKNLAGGSRVNCLLADSSFIQGYLSSILASMTIILAGVSVSAVLMAMRWREQADFHRMLGVTQQRPVIRLYLSRVNVQPHGSHGASLESPDAFQGYVGPCLIRTEYDAALCLQKSIDDRSIPIVDYLRGKLAFAKPDCAIEPSPPSSNSLLTFRKNNLILLGSDYYNSLTGYYLSLPSAEFEFRRAKSGDDEELKLVMKGDNEAEIKIPGRSKKREIGIVQKLIDEETGNTVIICAGLGSCATAACAVWLHRHWRDLYKKHGLSPFSRVLIFQDLPPDQADKLDPVPEPDRVLEQNSDRSQIPTHDGPHFSGVSGHTS